MRSLPTLVVLAALAGPARAEEPTTRTDNYGNTIFVLDAIALGIAIPSVVGLHLTDGGAGRVLSIIGTSVGGALYLFGGPLVHNAKQRMKDKYYLSMALRGLGAGLVGAAGASIGERYCSEEEKGNCREIATAFAISFGVGAIVVSAIDIRWLAKRQVVVAPAPGGAVIGLGGRF